MGRAVRKRMCTGKKVYKTLFQAFVYAGKYSQRVYRCPFCKKYHLSSKDTWIPEVKK